MYLFRMDIIAAIAAVVVAIVEVIRLAMDLSKKALIVYN